MAAASAVQALPVNPNDGFLPSFEPSTLLSKPVRALKPVRKAAGPFFGRDLRNFAPHQMDSANIYPRPGYSLFISQQPQTVATVSAFDLYGPSYASNPVINSLRGTSGGSSSGGSSSGGVGGPTTTTFKPGSAGGAPQEFFDRVLQDQTVELSPDGSGDAPVSWGDFFPGGNSQGDSLGDLASGGGNVGAVPLPAAAPLLLAALAGLGLIARRKRRAEA